jgi:hypothetical protein
MRWETDHLSHHHLIINDLAASMSEAAPQF